MACLRRINGLTAEYLTDEFNETAGSEENICVKVTSVSTTNTIHEGILTAAFGDAGAPEIPDMFVSYPKTVLAIPDNTVLVYYSDYFTDEELQAFIPSFIEECTFSVFQSGHRPAG